MTETCAAAADDLPPGVRRLRPDDHFMIAIETDASPMQLGALMIFDVPAAQKHQFRLRIAAHIAERLAHTPLLARLHASPDGYDSNVWADVAACAIDDHLRYTGEDLDDTTLRRVIAQRCMVRLDLSRPPFAVDVFDNLTDGRCAIYVKVHHAIVDGVGFQSILYLLSDRTSPAPHRAADAVLPPAGAWRAAAEQHFAALETIRCQNVDRRAQARAAIAVMEADPLTRRAVTPDFRFSGPTSPHRVYATAQLDLARVKAVGRGLRGTVNDIFLALGAAALRRFLIGCGGLPAAPIVANSARSYRRPEHGAFGNRIVALHPHLATHLADPVARLRAIQASMANEQRRSQHEEALLDQPDWPYGAAERRARLGASARGDRVLPGNVTFSNVPGPAVPLSYAGFQQQANYPVPLLGSGRFLNITSRRTGDALDLGIIADRTKITELDWVSDYMHAALAEYESIAARGV